MNRTNSFTARDSAPFGTAFAVRGVTQLRALAHARAGALELAARQGPQMLSEALAATYSMADSLCINAEEGGVGEDEHEIFASFIAPRMERQLFLERNFKPIAKMAHGLLRGDGTALNHLLHGLRTLSINTQEAADFEVALQADLAVRINLRQVLARGAKTMGAKPRSYQEVDAIRGALVSIAQSGSLPRWAAATVNRLAGYVTWVGPSTSVRHSGGAAAELTACLTFWADHFAARETVSGWGVPPLNAPVFGAARTEVAAAASEAAGAPAAGRGEWEASLVRAGQEMTARSNLLVWARALGDQISGIAMRPDGSRMPNVASALAAARAVLAQARCIENIQLLPEAVVTVFKEVTDLFDGLTDLSTQGDLQQATVDAAFVHSKRLVRGLCDLAPVEIAEYTEPKAPAEPVVAAPAPAPAPVRAAVEKPSTDVWAAVEAAIAEALRADPSNLGMVALAAHSLTQHMLDFHTAPAVAA